MREKVFLSDNDGTLTVARKKIVGEAISKKVAGFGGRQKSVRKPPKS